MPKPRTHNRGGNNNPKRSLTQWCRQTRLGKRLFHNTSPQQAMAPSYSETGHSPPLHSCGTVFLKFNYGKCVGLSNADGLTLVAKDAQKGSLRGNGNVQIWKWGNYIALCVHDRNGSYLVTEDDTGLLELKKTTDVKQTIQTLTTCFVKNNGGGVTGKYFLHTANPQDPNSPSKYLVIDEEDHITLSDHRPLNSSCNFLTTSLQCHEMGCSGL